jgi:DNA-binding transcriptional regulator GbsR (MarR family)
MVSINKKFAKKLGSDFTSAFADKTPDEIKQFLVKCEQRIAAVTDKRKADATLNELKEQVKALNGGYSDVIKNEKDKIEFFLDLITQMEGHISISEPEMRD